MKRATADGYRKIIAEGEWKVPDAAIGWGDDWLEKSRRNIMSILPTVCINPFATKLDEIMFKYPIMLCHESRFFDVILEVYGEYFTNIEKMTIESIRDVGGSPANWVTIVNRMCN